MKVDTSKYAERLREAAKNGDVESAHIEADSVLCDLLEELGHADIVALFDKVEKWYA